MKNALIEVLEDEYKIKLYSTNGDYIRSAVMRKVKHSGEFITLDELYTILKRNWKVQGILCAKKI